MPQLDCPITPSIFFVFGSETIFGTDGEHYLFDAVFGRHVFDGDLFKGIEKRPSIRGNRFARGLVHMLLSLEGGRASVELGSLKASST